MKRASSAGASTSSRKLPPASPATASKRRHRADAVDVPGHQVAPQPVGEAQRHLHVDVADAIEAGRAGERRRRHVERERRAVDLDDRQAAAVDRDAVAHGDVGDVANADVERDAQAVAFRLGRGDPSHRLHDSGEHQAPPTRAATTRATMRRSSPTRATSMERRAPRGRQRSERPSRHSAMPRAGSPSRQGAR